MNRESIEVLTVGHSNLSVEDFISLLRGQGVTAVGDVRSSPYSRYTPQFGREALQVTLRAAGLEYVFLGRELGARSDDPAHYEDGRVQYESLRQSPLFQKGVERVLRGARRFRLALMCAEKEPLQCHRTLLVAPELVERGVKVGHLLGDGSVESHEQALDRLLDLTGTPKADLFMDRDALVAQALKRQSRRVAWIDQRFSEEGS